MIDASILAALIAAASNLGKPLIEAALRSYERLSGKPLKVAGSLLDDDVYAWQTVNRIQLAARVDQILTDEGVPSRILPNGFLIRAIDGATCVDDPDARELWARLLVSAVKDEAAARPAYVETLKHIGATEAGLIEKMIRTPEFYVWDHRRPTPLEDAAAEVLLSLGVLEHPPQMSGQVMLTSMERGGGYPPMVMAKLSRYGQSFAGTVLPPVPKWENEPGALTVPS